MNAGMAGMMAGECEFMLARLTRGRRNCLPNSKTKKKKKKVLHRSGVESGGNESNHTSSQCHVENFFRNN